MGLPKAISVLGFKWRGGEGRGIIGSHYQTKLCSLLWDAMGKNALSALRKLQGWLPVGNVIQRTESLFRIFPLNLVKNLLTATFKVCRCWLGCYFQGGETVIFICPISSKHCPALTPYPVKEFQETTQQDFVECIHSFSNITLIKVTRLFTLLCWRLRKWENPWLRGLPAFMQDRKCK